MIPKSSDDVPRICKVDWLEVSSTSRLAGTAKTKIAWRNVSMSREHLASLQGAIEAWQKSRWLWMPAMITAQDPNHLAPMDGSWGIGIKAVNFCEEDFER